MMNIKDIVFHIAEKGERIPFSQYPKDKIDSLYIFTSKISGLIEIQLKNTNKELVWSFFPESLHVALQVCQKIREYFPDAPITTNDVTEQMIKEAVLTVIFLRELNNNSELVKNSLQLVENLIKL
jgi:hypothetical protein